MAGSPDRAARRGVDAATSPAPDPWDALVVLVLAYLPGSLLVGAVAAAAAPPWQMPVRLAGFAVVLIAVVLAWSALRPDRSVTGVVGGRPEAREVGVGAVVGLVIGVVLAAVGLAATPVLEGLGVDLVSPQEPLQEALRAPASGVVVALVAVTVTPLGEELAFRGVVHRAARRLLARPVAVGASAVVFAALHVPGGNLAGAVQVFLTLVVAAAVFALLVERHGHVWGAVAAHAAYNAVGVAVIVLL